MAIGLDSPLTKLKGVGPAVAQKLIYLNLRQVKDLLYFYPRRYEDYSQISTIDSIQPGLVSLRVRFDDIKASYIRRGLHLTKAVASDNTGRLAVTWFNQPYRAKALNPTKEYFMSGQYELRSGRLNLVNPSVELVSDLPVTTARIVPIYRQTKGLTSLQIRRLFIEIKPLISKLADDLPASLLKEYQLVSLSEAVRMIHFPKTSAEIDLAKQRFGFEEIFCLSLAGQLNRMDQAQGKGQKLVFDQSLTSQFVSSLPFKLTDQQRQISWRIITEIQKSTPMNRLVEGDVGSGKTLLAVMASLSAISSGKQVAFMAPTEILAAQHAKTIERLLGPINKADQVVLLSGSLAVKDRESALKSIKNGSKSFVVGTHALFQKTVSFKDLALVIVDEQHRFGVNQRKKLQQKAKLMPHILHLSATPIPRSLALTLYGELSISRLTSRPDGRRPVITEIINDGAQPQLVREVTRQLRSGRQVFIVCPLIEDSGQGDLKSAKEIYEQTKRQYPDYSVGLIHGRQKSNLKESTMEAFNNGELKILVSTTVVEVGVDVPNATVMIIQDAEQFGLAQIHQLRGRVGRGEHQAYCYLMLSSGQEQPSRRLKALKSSSDGFKLADLDLQLRGPGALYGMAQHGQLDLTMADLSDLNKIRLARKAAIDFIARNNDLSLYPKLNQKVQHLRTITNLS